MKQNLFDAMLVTGRLHGLLKMRTFIFIPFFLLSAANTNGQPQRSDTKARMAATDAATNAPQETAGFAPQIEVESDSCQASCR